MPTATPTSRPIPPELEEVLDEFRRTRGMEARLWHRTERGWKTTGSAEIAGDPPPGSLSFGGDRFRVVVNGASEEETRRESRFLAAVLGSLLRLRDEVVDMSNEIAERYEEITLLYSISETLGSVISIEEAAGTILTEVISTLGARRAALWVHDPDREELYLAAEVGMNGQRGPIRVDDPTSATAAVFRTHRAVLMDPDDVFPRGEHDRGSTERGSFLSVPVSYTPPQGETRTVGVINLVGRESDRTFSPATSSSSPPSRARSAPPSRTTASWPNRCARSGSSARWSSRTTCS
jgi:hypothetical protein